MNEKIIIKGAKEHNLKNVSLEIPRDKMVVITGLSGSGKSSLAFDTIYAEGQRRYMESLSSYARQFLGQMEKPNVEEIEGLSPAISIDQKTTSKNPRSTVATVTEIHDYFRLLYARIGIPHCPVCGKEIKSLSVDQMVDRMMELPEGTRLTIMAPVVRGRKGEHEKVLERIRKEGFTRVRADGEMYLLDEDDIKLEKNFKHTIEIVVDRVIVKPGQESRIAEAVELGVSHGEGLITALAGEQTLTFNTKLALYSYDDNPDDTGIDNVLRQSLDLIGYFPSLISYGYKAKRSCLENDTSFVQHKPEATLSTAENILHMTRPSGEFEDIEAKILDITLMLHAEHGGGNNSSFTTHLVSSSGTDTYGVIAAAISSLKGPRHGGANLAACRMVDDLKDNVKDITNEALLRDYFIKVLEGKANDGSGLIYGLGHAIYTLSDPRAVLLKDLAKKLALSKHMEEDYMLCKFIEEKVPDIYREFTGDANALMPANVDLYSGFIYRALGIPDDISTPLFALSRLSGWCAHRIEELIAGNRLMRPAYFGINESTDYIPLSDRKR